MSNIGFNNQDWYDRYKELMEQLGRSIQDEVSHKYYWLGYDIKAKERKEAKVSKHIRNRERTEERVMWSVPKKIRPTKLGYNTRR